MIFPPVKHQDVGERKEAILSIFNSMRPEVIFDMGITVGKLQGPIKLSQDVKNEDEVNMAETVARMRESMFLIEEDEVDIDPNWTLYEHATKNTPPSWEPVFRGVDAILKRISGMLDGIKCFPLMEDRFRAFHVTRFDKVRAVIVGLDPFHQETGGVPDACGLSFSYRRSFPIPPRSCLRNIFKEILNNYPDSFVAPWHGDLTSWAKQGILMLNTSLTVLPGSPNSHVELWKAFLVYLIKAIMEANPGTIFILWGAIAQKLKSELGNRAVVLEAAHPSGHSVKGFYGCRHFIKVNEILAQQGHDQIDWNLDPAPKKTTVNVAPSVAPSIMAISF
jgi:uracil-DNA glycosylase